MWQQSLSFLLGSKQKYEEKAVMNAVGKIDRDVGVSGILTSVGEDFVVTDVVE